MPRKGYRQPKSHRRKIADGNRTYRQRILEALQTIEEIKKDPSILQPHIKRTGTHSRHAKPKPPNPAPTPIPPSAGPINRPKQKHGLYHKVQQLSSNGSTKEYVYKRYGDPADTIIDLTKQALEIKKKLAKGVPGIDPWPKQLYIWTRIEDKPGQPIILPYEIPESLVDKLDKNYWQELRKL